MRISFFSVLKGVAILALLAGIVVAGYAAYSRLPAILEDLAASSRTPKVRPRQEVIVSIPKGASLSQVAALLEEQGVISSRLVFKIVAAIRGEQRKIQAGEYSVKTGSDAGDVLDLLISGKTLMFTFTVPEGYNIYQVADLFQQSGVMSRSDFLNMAQDKLTLKELGVEGDSLEGYLFPDTYFIRPSEKKDGKLLVRRMVKRFYEVYDKEVRPIAEAHKWKTKDVVTLASLIEKEARQSEHAFVSAVFHNRLQKGMRLQCDPTVIYGIKAMGSRITRRDLDNPHSYNTYQHAGLPPGPIANPGKDSLTAAVQPADVDYLYFVAKNDGTHQFSSTLKEHNRWVDLYQRNSRAEARTNNKANGPGVQ
ncbi:MAG: endolytic transglycosylase MltG [Thermodesulfobacteriota bacterium]